MAVVKYLVLLLLVMQTSFMVLILRYTRTVHKTGPRYLTSTVIFLAECVKLVTCLLIIFVGAKFNWRRLYVELRTGLFEHPMETIKVAVPSGIYAIQNNLLFVALSYLDAATYQVTYQLKILTTAICSVILLRRSLSRQQWAALLLLMIGVALVQMPTETEETDLTVTNRLFGLTVLLIACLSSGFAGVYFELLLKQSSLSLWIRNIQMAIFGMLFSAMTVLYSDWKAISKGGFLQGYDALVIAVLLLQAYGGLLVACAVQYTDNIIKGFATSISIILSSMISHFIFEDLQLTGLFMTGTIMVLGATFLYGWKRPTKGSVKES
ncbi:UDP-N-acetylglucosamine transporter-like [Clavelina lepadiformis]|uniref:UDP-N-acetylglucosamine transporter n=1 Tax=Clavelina lepadiformis TaxID=159417 RepID=A0ABP0H081_CLALP